ncbi:hypothetical protein ANOM_000753 [Aspergillus nomiae NRRL 13137]|uniref:Kinesin motor domain-containing protein n=1 Tax=Aspergillus nomiae NRRL (strain ATCC 15546 / NRRL 13137 / CBS 260.88 / M93) TaxID=1509407 RepID=A0A0L1JH81_ASPN3|nr:uncharacterized protein ANOM_000753 [Aspergillus nomiae NRRL 13137]KNG91057.1 hypothetical protein ANOM_000753 [Aspergillus nomiae NRRL 13137]
MGGRTKTCIIATVSPCQSNQEETISTLDYAFRAKNIHNRPQMNTPVPKDTLLSELASQIENLKRNLIATRHRNGVYMTYDAHEEMTKENESQRIINQEQQQRIEVLQSNLHHKAEELLALKRQLQHSGNLIEGLATHSRVDECITKPKQFVEEIVHLRSQLKVRMDQDKKTIDNEHLSARRAVVFAQKDLQQTVANCEDGFDEPVALWAQKLENTQSHNNQLIDAYRNKLNTLEATVQQSCSNVKGQLETVLQSCGQFQDDMLLRSYSIEQPIATLEKDFYKPLSHLQESIRSPISRISAFLKRLSEPTNTLPQNGNGASSTSSVHEGLREKNFHDRQQVTDSDRGGILPWIPGNPVEQACSEVTSDNDEPRLKRRRI